MKIIDNLTEYMVAARAAELPDNVVQKAKSHILDTLAAIVSGSQLKPGRLGLQYVRSQMGKPECVVLASNVLTTPPLAAFANGMSAHADETDDTISSLHPGCAIIPAALALAELQNCSGSEFLKSVVLGYDIGYRFHESFKRRSTSFGATFGAAVAAGSLARLDKKQLCYLISYAGQQASGSRAWVGDDEHVEKAFDYGGMPAQNGTTAALLVQMGFTGNRDILEGGTNIAETFVPCNLSELLNGLGRQYAITRCLIKKYPTGSPMMEAVDALIQIVQENEIHARDVAKVVVRLPSRGARLVNNRWMPDVNIQYILSAILIDGGLTFAAAHNHERMQDKQLLDVKERVQLVADDEFEHAEIRYQAVVEVTMRDGRTFRQHHKNCPGRPDNPLTPEDVEKKAAWLMEPVLGEQCTNKVLALVRAIESVPTLRDLTGLLTLDPY